MNSSGGVLSVQTEGVSMGPISLEVERRSFPRNGNGFQDWLEPDAPAERAEGVLRLGPVTVSWGSATLWEPRPDWARLRQGQASWRGRLGGLAEHLRSGAPAGGLAGLLGSGSDRPEPPTAIMDQLVAAAQAPALQVLTGIGASDADHRTIEGAIALAGLGGGLTPSGDDFLIGVMHALWATRGETAALEISTQLAGAAAPRTTPLSAAWLQAAADGEAADHWHDLLAALVEGDATAVDHSVRRLLAIGHTSGADAMTGFLGVLLGPEILGGMG